MVTDMAFNILQNNSICSFALQHFAWRACFCRSHKALNMRAWRITRFRNRRDVAFERGHNVRAPRTDNGETAWKADRHHRRQDL